MNRIMFCGKNKIMAGDLKWAGEYLLTKNVSRIETETGQQRTSRATPWQILILYPFVVALYRTGYRTTIGPSIAWTNHCILVINPLTTLRDRWMKVIHGMAFSLQSGLAFSAFHFVTLRQTPAHTPSVTCFMDGPWHCWPISTSSFV